MSETTVTKYCKDSLLKSKQFSTVEKDVINVVMKDDESCSIPEIKERIRKFRMRRIEK